MRKLLLVLLLLTWNETFSQDFGSITGTVTDKETRESLTSVTIIIKDKTASVCTPLNMVGFCNYKNYYPGIAGL